MKALRNIRLVIVALAGIGLLVAGCGSSGASPGAAATAGNADNGGGGEAAAGGGEAAGVRFVSPRFHYRVDAPGAMSEGADGTANARRGVESLTIKVVSGSSAADLKLYATSDLDAIRPASPNFQQVRGVSPVTISGRGAFKLIYRWSDGSNPATGKPLDLYTVRYYIPRDAGTAAVLVYSIAASQYDPQGADDVASTFAWQ